MAASRKAKRSGKKTTAGKSKAAKPRSPKGTPKKVSPRSAPKRPAPKAAGRATVSMGSGTDVTCEPGRHVNCLHAKRAAFLGIAATGMDPVRAQKR